MLAGVWLALLASACLGQKPAALLGGSASAPLLSVNGAIGPATADYIARGLEIAARSGAPLVVLQIDTPGGLDSSTRQIVKDILAAPMPVVAWVAPGGARAASAETYIIYASHVAAMAPGTNLGAATPVQIGGLPGTKPQPAPGNAPAPRATAPDGDDNSERAETPVSGDGMTRKIVNDSAAYLRSLAQMRGRNVEWADRAVREGVSLSAEEALEQNVIDFIAPDLPSLLKQAHGRVVQLDGETKHTVQSETVLIEALEPDWRTRLLAIITDPTMAYLLLLLGIYGIYFELTSPGFGFPGVAGIIALLLGMFALQMLPVNYAGVALIVLGFAMLVAEVLMPSFGALGIGGVIAFVIGSVMLIDTDSPGFGIPLGLIISVAVFNALFVVIVMRMALKARSRPVVSGAEELGGAPGEVLEVQGDQAWARIHGERWHVSSDDTLHRGQRVRVTARKGLILHVRPEPEARSDTTDS